MSSRPLHLMGFLLLAAPLAWGQVVININASGTGSLRAAVAAANPGATITFAPELSGLTISLGGSEIVLDKNLTIDASALPGGITLTQPPYLNQPLPIASRFFKVASGSKVKLESLTLQGGIAISDSLTGHTFSGGAIHNQGDLTLSSCTLHENFSLNGGAILNDGGALTINQCTITGNVGNNAVGALLSLSGSVDIVQSTITGNGTNNSIGTAGAVTILSGNIGIINSIVAGNGPTNITRTVEYQNNISNILGGDPQLLPLANYGGPTPTMPPRANSPALNAGTDVILFSGVFIPFPITSLFPTDQRGLLRLSGSHVDIGAVELQSTLVTNLDDAGPDSLRAAVSDPAVTDIVITFDQDLSGQTIDLTGGPLVLGHATTIDASALPGGMRLNGNGRVLEVPSGVTATLRALTLQNGYHISEGGGIHNAGALTLDRCTIANNGVSGESLTPQGGGIYNAGNLIIDQCTITSNRARSGSGIYNNVNTALTIRQSTIAGNESEVSTAGIRNNGDLTLFNSIVAGNNGSDLFPNFYEGGSVVRTGNNLTDGDPMLMSLGNYGGPTQTMPPHPSSPARNTGGTGGPGFASDQRGYPRIIGPAVDLGAVEEIPGATQLGANMADIWQSDSDRDGESFGIEYAVGTDPFTPEAGADGRLGISLDPTKRITFGRNPAAIPNTEWILKRSYDLQPGSFTEIYRFHGPTGVSTISGVTAAIDGSNGFTITDPTTADRAFYRIETRFTP